MKYTVRSGFETNSSSMHSIAITKMDGKTPTGYVGSNNELRFWGSVDLYYGRSPFHICNNLHDKVGYAIASYSRNDEKIKEIINIVKDEFGLDVIPPTTCLRRYQRIDTKEEVYWFDVEAATEADDAPLVLKSDDGIEVEVTEEEVIDASIDHQSAGLLQSFLKSHNVSLREFLCEEKYIVIIDGDEYCEWANIQPYVDETMIKEVF